MSLAEQQAAQRGRDKFHLGDGADFEISIRNQQRKVHDLTAVGSIAISANSDQSPAEVKRANVHRRSLKFELAGCEILRVNLCAGYGFLRFEGVELVLAVDVLNFLDKVETLVEKVISIQG